MRTLQTIQKREKLNIVNAVDEIGPGGANHLYAIIPVEDIETDGKNTAYNLIQMQYGPRNEKGSTHGIIDSDLLEIVRELNDPPKMVHRSTKGLDLTHNHPFNTPPSPEDLYLLKERRLKSIRACGKKGIYVIKYNQAIEKLPKYEIFNKEYNELYDNLFGDYYKEVRKGKLSGQEAERLMQEDVWEILKKKYNIDLQWIGG